MVTCVYLNPTIDKTVYMEQFVLGGTNRPKKVLLHAGGKAINVAAVLKELGHDVCVKGLLYRGDGEIIRKRLDAHNISYEFVELEGQSRTNTKIFNEQDRTITEINESGTTVSQDVIQKVAKNVIDCAEAGDIVVLTGSLPPGCPTDIYAVLIKELKKKQVKCILDADGEVLLLGMQQKPYLIKPNIDELRTVASLCGDSIEEIRDVCRSIIHSGISVVAISMGGDGALIFDERNGYFAKPQKVHVQSTVGAGDSMVAGMIAYLDKGIEQALRAGVAAATASITLEGTELCHSEMFQSFFDRVQIEKVD